MSDFALPIEPDLEDGEFDAKWESYQDQLWNYRFRQEWLPTAVSSDEYETALQLPISILKSLYEPVYKYGPHGFRWLLLITALLKTCDEAVCENVSAIFLLQDFTQTYQNDDFAAFRRDSKMLHRDLNEDLPWEALVAKASDLYRHDDVEPDLDTLMEPRVEAVLRHQVWGDIQHADSEFKLVKTVEHFSIMVLAEDLLHADAAFTKFLDGHAAFLRRHGWDAASNR